MTEAEDAQFAAEVAAVAREFGDTHTMVAEKHFEFGQLLSKRPGEEKRAIWQFESCLSIQRSNFGDMTLSVAVTLHKLGQLHSKMNNFRKALSAYYASLERYAHLFGKDTEQIADLLRDIARVYSRLGREDASGALLAKVAVLEEALTSGAQKTQYFIDIYADLAEIVAEEGNFSESDGLYRTCIQLAAHHQTGREAARYNFKYAKLLEGRFEMDLAEQYYFAAAELGIEFPELCLLTAECKYFLGYSAKDQHRLSDATKYLEEALELWTKHLGEKNALVGKCYLMIAQILRDMGEFESAIQYHERSIRVLSECSRSDLNPDDFSRIPGLKEAMSVDFLVHAKGELGITLQRHSQEEARRGISLVTDAVTHLTSKKYASEHPLVSTLLAAKERWREHDTSLGGEVSLDMTAETGPSMMTVSVSEDVPESSLVLSINDQSRPGTVSLSRPGTGLTSSGSSSPLSVRLTNDVSNALTEFQFREIYGSTGGSIGVSGENKSIPEIVDSLLAQAGDMLFEGRYLPANYTLSNCLQSAKLGLHLVDPITGARNADNVDLLNRIMLAAADSSRRVGHYEFARSQYIEIMDIRGINYSNVAKAAGNLQRSPFNSEKVGDIEILAGYLQNFLDQENVLAVGDSLDVLADAMSSYIDNGTIELYFSHNTGLPDSSKYDSNPRTLSRSGIVYARVLLAAADCHFQSGRLVSACEYVSRAGELLEGTDAAAAQMLSLHRILGDDGGPLFLYKQQRRVLLSEYSTLECSFLYFKAKLNFVLNDFADATATIRRFHRLLQHLDLPSSHPLHGMFEVVSAQLSLHQGCTADARVHNKKAFSIFSLTYLEDHSRLCEALFQSAEISRVEAMEHKASSTYAAVLEMIRRLRGEDTATEAVILASQAMNVLTNTFPSHNEFTEAILSLKSARAKLSKLFPYETHHLILWVDVTTLDAIRRQIVGEFNINLLDPDAYLMKTSELLASYSSLVSALKSLHEADYHNVPPTIYAAALTGNAKLLHYLGEYAESEKLLTAATEILRDTYSSDEFVEVTTSICNSARVAMDRGRLFPDLAGMISVDVDMKSRVLGKHHPAYADSLEILGRVLTNYGYFSADHYAKSQNALVQAAVVRSHVFGVGSLPVAAAEDALGILYARRNKFDDAIAYLNRSLTVRIGALGEGHRLVGESYAHLSLVYWSIGDLGMCKKYAQLFYDVTVSVLAGSHPVVLIAQAYLAKVCLMEVKTRILKVSNEEKEEMNKTYKNCREILIYGCGYERHAWWIMFLCGAKIASPSASWYELSPPEMDDPGSQFKLGNSTATSIAGRLVRADTDTNLLREKHEKLTDERDKLLEKFKEYEATMKIGDVMQLAAENKQLNDEISSLNEKLAEAGGLLVQRDVAEIDLLSIHKLHRNEEELHKSELARLRGAVSVEEKSHSYVRLPDSELQDRIDQVPINNVIAEKLQLKSLITAVEKQNTDLLASRKALLDELVFVDTGIKKVQDFLLNSDTERNELLLQIGATNVTALKLSTRLGKKKKNMSQSGELVESIDILRNAFDELVAETSKVTENEAAIEYAESAIIQLTRDVEGYQYDLEVGAKNMTKRVIAKLNESLAAAEAQIVQRRNELVKRNQDKKVLGAHIALLQQKLKDAQLLLFILKGVVPSKVENLYQKAPSIWSEMYARCKARDDIRMKIDNFKDLDTDRTLDDFNADLKVATAAVNEVRKHLEAIELQEPSRTVDENAELIEDKTFPVYSPRVNAASDSEYVARAKNDVATKESIVSALWSTVLSSLKEQEALKSSISDIQSQIGSNEIKMRNLRQSVKAGSSKNPTLQRQYSSSTANDKSMAEVNLILDEAEKRQIHLKEKLIHLNNQLISICERENLGTLVQSMSPAIVAESYAKDLGIKLGKMDEEKAAMAAEISKNKTEIAIASKDLHVLEVEISRIEGAKKSEGSSKPFQSRDPDVARLVSVLKSRELASIDEVSAEQEASIQLGIIREREEKQRNDLALARQALVNSPKNTAESKSRLVGLVQEQKDIIKEIELSTAVRDEKKRLYEQLLAESSTMASDAALVATSNERAASPLLKERGESLMGILTKIKSSNDSRVKQVKKELDTVLEKLLVLSSQKEEVTSSIAIIESEISKLSEKKSYQGPPIDELEANVRALEEQYRRTAEEHARAQEALDSLKRTVENTDREKHELRQKIQEMIEKEKKSLSEAGADLPKLINDRSALSIEMTKLAELLSKNQAAEKALEEELQQSKAKFNEVNSYLLDAIETNKQSLATEQDLKLLKSRSTKMEREISTKLLNETPQETMAKTQKLIDELTAEEQGLIAKLEVVDQRIDMDQAALTVAVEECRVSKNILLHAEKKFDQSHLLEQESIVSIGRMEARVRELEANIAERAEQLQELRKQRRGFLDELNKIDIEVVAVNAEKARLLSRTEPVGPVEIEACHARKDKIAREIEILRAWIAREEQRRFMEFHPDSKKKLEEDLLKAKDLTVLGLLALTDSSKHYDNKLADAAKEITKRDNFLAEASAEEKKLRSTIDKCHIDIDTLHGEIEKLKLALKEANETIEWRNITISDKIAVIEEVEKKLEELPTWENKLLLAESKIQSLEGTVRDLNGAIQSRDTVIESLNKSLSDATDKVQRQESSLKEINKLRVNLENSLSQKTAEAERLHEKVSELECDFGNLQSKSASYESTIIKNEKEKARLAGELSRAEESVTALKKQLTPLEIKEAQQQEELEKARVHIKKIEEELHTALNMRKSLDPWGFGKEAEAGFSRFATIKNIVEPESGAANAWEKDHDTKESHILQKRAFEDPLQPPIMAFDQLNQGAAPVKIFGGVRALKLKSDGRDTNDRNDLKICAHCGRDPHGLTGKGGGLIASHGRRFEDLKTVPTYVSAASTLEGVSPREENQEQLKTSTSPAVPVVGEDSFGSANSRGSKRTGMFPALEGNLKPASAGKGNGKNRVKKNLPDKFSKSTPSQLHVAFGGEPFSEILTPNASNQDSIVPSPSTKNGLRDDSLISSNTTITRKL